MARVLLLCPSDAVGAGAGHVVRAIALGEAWRDDGGEVVLAHTDLPDSLASRATAAGLSLHRLDGAGPDAVQRAASRTEAGWVVLDGYDFGVAHQRAAASEGAVVGVVDDHGIVGSYDVDVVVDQNLAADRDAYRRRALRSIALLGERYVLLRRAFTEPVGLGRRDGVLLTLGGSADAGAIDELRDAIAGAVPGVDIAVARGDVEDMAALMRTRAVAVSAAGTTVWELSATRTPMVLVTVADNQVPNAEALAARGVADYLGPLSGVAASEVADAVAALLADTDRRHSLADAASTIVDGRGGRRVVGALRSAAVSLRPARPDDARQIWEWANDPTVREVSISTAPIAWEDHVRWYTARLASDATWIRVAEVDGRAVGQIRFDRRDDELEISIVVDAAHRGNHIGAALLARGTASVAPVANVGRVAGLIRPTNAASIGAFLAAGFQPDGETTRDGVLMRRFVRFVDD